ncbi:N-acetylmuramidase family protein [Acinetobacter radioresistens]|uniref:N-acetylmuramidase family protein n=1 Tax=Acinetobacter radioresistens TaxID=40216 RepID=A0A8H2K5P3_ACIRA|nr:N-acetylmuramidase family protein [Acinetobacter radioresistens]TNX94290.1 N-acetylmuramidase family protein [Acinetobacter radioresistens]
MSKNLTTAQIEAQAKALGVEVAALRAVIEVECKGAGFNPDGTPVILYERHKFYEGLQAINWITKSKEWSKQFPDLCNPAPGAYGKYSAQHDKLERAAKLNREVALESCSWGIGQVMGYHWKSLGYPTLQAFINAMYKDEASQLEAMCRYIKVNGLIGALRKKDWKAFARGYNGPMYAKNSYDVKLAKAYKKWSA